MTNEEQDDWQYRRLRLWYDARLLLQNAHRLLEFAEAHARDAYDNLEPEDIEEIQAFREREPGDA